MDFKEIPKSSKIARKTQKMVFDTSFLNTLYYNVLIKGKVG